MSNLQSWFIRKINKNIIKWLMISEPLQRINNVIDCSVIKNPAEKRTFNIKGAKRVHNYMNRIGWRIRMCREHGMSLRSLRWISTYGSNVSSSKSVSTKSQRNFWVNNSFAFCICSTWNKLICVRTGKFSRVDPWS